MLLWGMYFLQWLSDFFWPGDYDRRSAKAAYKAYMGSKNITSLKYSIGRFEIAVEQYRKHKNAALSMTLVDCAVAIWTHYEDAGQALDDLDRVIRLGTEARKSWSGKKVTSTYLFLLSALARAHFEQYQRAFGPCPIKPGAKKKAFDKAVKYLTELESNPGADGGQRRAAQLQLGIIFRMRCELERTLDGFNIGVQQLQSALLEATPARQDAGAGFKAAVEEKQGMTAGGNDVTATCLLNLATLYETRYELVEDSQKIRDLAIAIDYSTQARCLLETLQHPELPTCLVNLARQLWIRWRHTGDRSDYVTAKQVADAAQAIPGLNQALTDSINQLLDVLQTESQPDTFNSALTEPPRDADCPSTPFPGGETGTMSQQCE